MKYTEHQAALESAAMQTESRERIAEERFDAAYARAEERGTVASVTTTAEFGEWMSARAETDAAWGRWAQAMDEANC
jgi:hypothetical protein